LALPVLLMVPPGKYNFPILQQVMPSDQGKLAQF
jgi:hypothetical protein